MDYTNQEYCDMFLIYGASNQNAHEAARRYSAIEEDSSTSIRQISRTLGMTKSTVHNILKEIGPFELPPRVNGEIYKNFLENDLPILLENVPLHLRRNVIFQHDGTPMHTYRNVCRFLDTIYPNRWIGRNGSQYWPARSPDLTLIDFFSGDI
ncbi:hypothetical protein ALC60_01866 [Trachymyrmex zeteki]|uniref:DUF4817 domain-containing protein n=1 Tax=Mycetomoellerius zeteki TaxID=64791 RepID=A0A151XFG7_9HYME|nr:hypothetical protein ALC60_01866 [Trachymyrmex zeteki]